MPDLIAQGTRRQQRWRRPLSRGELFCVGRAKGSWSIHWDDQISREHALLRWNGEVLEVEVHERARNPVFFHGAAVQQCRLRPGEHFVVGETTFTFSGNEVSLAPEARTPAGEQTFSPEYLRRIPFRDPARRIEILSRLPERIAAASERQQLYDAVVRVMLEGIPMAFAVALVDASTLSPSHTLDQVHFLHWDSVAKSSEPMQLSAGLVREAISTRESVVHTWGAAQQDDFTALNDMDWAFCTPLPGTHCDGWCLYVCGGANDVDHDSAEPFGGPTDLRDEMKFAEVVATTFSSFLEVRALQARQSALGQFFSPPVIAVLEKSDPDQALAPREVDVTVFFSDLRGFSLETERSADDLFGLLSRVSDALGVITRHILHEGGVIGDFHGDAAMGFWGWPITQSDTPERAARTAMAISRKFGQESRRRDHPLANFRIGMGMASGRVVAGKIGTADQVKVTAFGPAVNLAARLESMSRRLNANILLDGATAKSLAGKLDKDIGRLRRLVVVRPYGMETPEDIYELLAPAAEDPIMSDEHIQYYEQALEAFVSGDWHRAWELLHQVPAADTSKDFLTTYIASRGRQAPADWDGVAELDWK